MAKPTVKLTAAEKREISRILETARGDGKVHSAQDTLPFRQMYPDGLCKLDDHTWSKCIEFEDVNYQLAKPDDQTAIFEALCDMYNAHDASIGMQLSLVSRRMNREDFVKRIEIAAQGDHFDHIRELYTQMLRKQLERGNNGLIKTKYLTLTIEARDSKTARARFSRIVMDALNHFKVMGALAKELGGKEWLEMLHGILHPDGERFAFEWSWLAPSGLSVQDFIAPSSFRFGEARKFTMADKFCAVSFLQISAPEMDDRMLTELLDTDSGLLVSLHIRSMNQNEAIKTVKRKITDIDSMKIDAQKKAVREGFDMDIIPTDLATYAGEAKNILRDLQSRNERMFQMTFLVVNFADSKQKLENDLLRAASVAQKYNCSLVRLDFQQEDGFVSALPLGVNRIKIQRGLTTSAVAVFVPFTTQEIFHGGEALYTDQELLPHLRSTIHDTLTEIVKKGLDKERLDASLCQFAFRMRDRDSGGSPRSLNEALELLDTWLYGGDPAEGVTVEQPIRELLGKRDSGYFEELIRELFLDNDHTVTVILVPSNTLSHEKAEREQQRITVAANRWTSAEWDTFAKETEALKQWQQTPDSEDALAAIPMLRLDDLPDAPEPVEVMQTHCQDIPMLCHKLPSELAHFRVHFLATDLETWELPALSIFCRLLGSMAAGRHSRSLLPLQIKRILGQLDIYPTILAGNTPEHCKIYLSVSAVCLPEQSAAAADLLTKILTQTLWEDTALLQDILQQMNALGFHG